MSAALVKTPCFVGVDTSNYTTSVAVTALDEEGNLTVVANLKYPLPVKAGERGLRQSDAVFAHVKNLPLAMSDLHGVLSEGGYEISAIGYSATPRDAEGSYMPCFLAGRVAATALSTGASGCGEMIPLYEFSHQSGHIMAALYASGALDQTEVDFLSAPFLAFHVSGGTTEAVVATASDAASSAFSVTLAGEGADLHAGQVIDRVGVMMGLKFPCGKEMEALAADYLAVNPPVKGLKVSVKDGVSHLSGLENMASELWRRTGDKGQVSAYVLSFIGKTLRRMTDQIQSARAERGEDFLPVVYAGGVMSNKLIRPMLKDGAAWATYFAEPAFSADNAAGVALLTAKKYMHAKA